MKAWFCSGSSTSSSAAAGSPRKSCPSLSISSSIISGLTAATPPMVLTIPPRRPEEAQEGPPHLVGGEPPHGNVLEDALFGLGQPEVLALQDPRRVLDVE